MDRPTRPVGSAGNDIVYLTDGTYKRGPNAVLRPRKLFIDKTSGKIDRQGTPYGIFMGLSMLNARFYWSDNLVLVLDCGLQRLYALQ
jgi:hypothetical protein